MVKIIKFTKDFYDLILSAKAPGVSALPLVAPAQVFAIVAVYLTFLCKLGPQFMKNRPPFKLDRIILVYNGVQVFACAYIFLKGVMIYVQTYSLFCQPPERLDTPESWNITVMCYLYYLMKIADLFDTVFFILRKKFAHVSFLHVYHHAGMVVLSAGSVNYLPGGHGSSIGVINSFVHCIMYSYYFLALYKPDYKKNIWWKKYITQLQIVQFFINVVHTGSILFIANCEYPKFVAFIVVPQNIFMLLLFADFYYKEYVQKPVKATCTLKNHHGGDMKQK